MAPRADDCIAESRIEPEKARLTADVWPIRYSSLGYSASLVPGSAFIIAMTTFVTTFSLAFKLDHVQTAAPFISLTGNKAPESHCFAFGLTVVGVLIGIGALLVHEYLETSFANDVGYENYLQKLKIWNDRACNTMIGGGAFLALLASFPLQHNAEDVFLQKAHGMSVWSIVHATFAVLFFATSYCHLAISVWLFWLHHRCFNASMKIKLICFLFCTVFAVLCPFLAQGAVGIVEVRQSVYGAPLTQYGLVLSVTLFYASYFFDLRGYRFGIKNLHPDSTAQQQQ